MHATYDRKCERARWEFVPRRSGEPYNEDEQANEQVVLQHGVDGHIDCKTAQQRSTRQSDGARYTDAGWRLLLSFIFIPRAGRYVEGAVDRSPRRGTYQGSEASSVVVLFPGGT